MNAEEPEARSGHFSAIIEGKMYIWGGFNRYNRPSRVETFDPCLEEWTGVPTTGRTPPGLSSGACASSEHCFYTYGGFDDRGFDTASLHQLDVRTHTWSLLSYTAQAADGPQKKFGCRMVYVQGMLVLFGGFMETGGTDELHSYNLKEGQYSGLGSRIF